MVDYSKAQTSKAAKEAFDSTIDSLIKAIQAIKGENDVEWEVVEEYRKGRAAIIEDVIPILKAHNIKLEKPLSRCNHEELMAELRQAAEQLPYEAREEVEVAMVRIDGRYTQIVEQTKKLEAISAKLAKFHLPEKDYDQEVVISFEELKKAHETKKEEAPKATPMPTRESRIVKNDPDLEEVVNVSKANEELISSFNDLVEAEKAEQVEIEETEEIEEKTPMILEEGDILSIEEDETEINFDDAFDSLFEDEKTSDDASLMEEFLEGKEQELEKEEEVSPEEVDYQTYELKSDQTLAEIVDYVYDGKLSWYDIYRYGNNQGMIDRKCAESNMDPEDAAYTAGALTGIDIEYPKNFVTYESIRKDRTQEDQEEKGYARAA